MIGIIAGNEKTYEVFGTINDPNPIEGKLYYDPKDNRVYYYSTTNTRSNPTSGYFPIWDGKTFYISKFSNQKYFDKDVTNMDVLVLSSNINKDMADMIKYNQRKSLNDTILKPQISDEDNAFTQCIKGIISKKKITMVDLFDMGCPPLSEKRVESFYSSLNKITFMRMDKFHTWLDVILHMNYTVEVFKDDKLLIKYFYPENKFDTGIVKYSSIINNKTDDPYKKMIRILMLSQNIDKATLKNNEDINDYTINNMMTNINTDKPLSAQLFSRFIRLSGLSYIIKIYESGKEIFEYSE